VKLIRIIGVDPGCEWLLPFAKKKLAQLAAAHGGFAAVNTLHVDGIDIRLQTYDAESGSIRIQGAVVGGYRFFTTGPALQTDTRKSPASWLGHAVQVVYDPKTDALRGKPLGSTLKKDEKDPARWPYLGPPNDPDKITAKLYHQWQIEGIVEFAQYTEDGQMLMTSWGAERDLPLLAHHSRMPGPRESLDIGYDLAPTQYKGARTLLPYKVPEMDWYRRGTLRTVTHPQFGTRTFIIMSDISNAFAVYPANTPRDVPDFYDAQEKKTTITDKAVKRFTPTLPTWANAATSQSSVAMATGPLDFQFFVDHPQYLWKFNSTGTYCAALLSHTFPNVPRSTGWPKAFPNQQTNDVGGRGFTYPEQGTVERCPRITPDGAVLGGADRDSLPGIVEYRIEIELIGPEPKDFTFSMVQVFEEDPRSSGLYPIAIDYAWDIGKPLTQERDDLLVMYGDVWHKCTGWHDRYHDYSVHFIVRNLRKSLDIFFARGEGLTITGTKFEDYRDVSGRYGEIEHDALRLNIAAIDLRFGGLVLERRLIHKKGLGTGKIYAEEESAVKIETYAWGELQETKWLTSNPTLNSRLDSLLSQNPIAEVGYVRYSPLRRGDQYYTPIIGADDDLVERLPYGPWLAPGYVWVYDATRIWMARWWEYCFSRGVDVETGQPLIPGGNVLTDIRPLFAQSYTGAKMYGALVNSAITVTAASRFTAHPHGHWSVSTALCAFYCGKSLEPFASTVGDSLARIDGQNPTSSLYDINNFKQDFVDIVSFRLYEEQPDGSILARDVRASHWELARDAYDEKWVKEDFFCNVTETDKEIPTGTPGYSTVLRSAKFKHKYKGEDGTDHLIMRLFAISVGGGVSGYFARISPQLFELNRRIRIPHQYAWTVNSDMAYGLGSPFLQVGVFSEAMVREDTIAGQAVERDDPAGRITLSSHVLNGSAIFVGTVTTEPPKETP
jgi:hypothetical protein